MFLITLLRRLFSFSQKFPGHEPPFYTFLWEPQPFKSAAKIFCAAGCACVECNFDSFIFLTGIISVTLSVLVPQLCQQLTPASLTRSNPHADIQQVEITTTHPFVSAIFMKPILGFRMISTLPGRASRDSGAPPVVKNKEFLSCRLHFLKAVMGSAKIRVNILRNEP